MKNKNINYKNQHKFSPAPFTLTSKLPTPPPEGAPRSLREHSEPSPPCGRARLRRGAACGGASHPPPLRGGGRGVGDNIILLYKIISKTIIRLVGKNIFLIFYFYLPKSKNIIYFCPYLFLSSNFG